MYCQLPFFDNRVSVCVGFNDRDVELAILEVHDHHNCNNAKNIDMFVSIQMSLVAILVSCGRF